MNNTTDVFDSLFEILALTWKICFASVIVLFVGWNLYNGLTWSEIWDSITPLAGAVVFSVTGLTSIPVALVIWFIVLVRQ